MRDDHAYVMQVKLCKANTRGVTSLSLYMLLLALECCATKTYILAFA